MNMLNKKNMMKKIIEMNRIFDNNEMMEECSKEYERKNHTCKGKARHSMKIEIKLIEGEEDLDIQELKRSGYIIENKEPLWGWFIQNWRDDPYKGCIFSFEKIKVCPLCGEELLV